jgi:2-iminobutanoate/2-iminopropanoate deaminase
MKEAVQTQSAPTPAGPYSQAIVLENLIFVAGQVAVDPATGELVSGEIQEQTEQVFNNIEAILGEAQSGLDNVVKVSVFLTDMANFAAMNAIYARRFRPPYPARTTVQAGMGPGMLIEVEVIACRRGS